MPAVVSEVGERGVDWEVGDVAHWRGRRRGSERRRRRWGEKGDAAGADWTADRTGAFILLNTGENVIHSKHGLLTTLAFKLGPKAPTNYALEGSIAIAGAAVQWLRDSLGIISSASEIEELAKQVDSTGGVYFVPAFNGLFAPWWRDDARGVCIGITRFTNKSHIARAVLESMCFQVKDVLDSMHKDAGEKGENRNAKGEFLLRVDGGATVNNLLMQLQLLGCCFVEASLGSLLLFMNAWVLLFWFWFVFIILSNLWYLFYSWFLGGFVASL
ncbi:hypothetical protein MANES_11G060045v8 [Manihot esculenta]|uniref:Uncharacterized protein n=1 Tax=Manihot esculenta TaxID=3983 RepID=A0ACB7GUR3_MANES|nr:hypothetical protein MANES_11G060045v8 [Manihot esculenta]